MRPAGSLKPCDSVVRRFVRLVLGLATALLGMALVASSAIATPNFHSEDEHTVLTGKAINTQVLKTGAEELSCKTATANGTTVAEASAALALAPSFGECKFKSGEESFTAHVEAGGCYFEDSASKEVEEGHLFEGSAKIGCGKPEQKLKVSLTILGKTYACLAIGAQTTTGTVTYTREGSGTGRKLKLKTELGGIAFTREGACGEGAGSGATYSGEMTVSGEDEGKAAVGIWVGEIHFHTGATSVGTVSGASLGTQLIKTAAGDEVSCKTGTLEGETTGKAIETLVLLPDYAECKFKGGGEEFNASILTECYIGFVATDVIETGHQYSGPASIMCESGEEAIRIRLHILGKDYPCLVLASQRPEGAVTYTREGSGIGRTLKLALALTGMEVKREGLCGEGSTESGSYTGEFKVSGYDLEKEQGVWLGRENALFTSGSAETPLKASALSNQVFHSASGETRCEKIQLTGTAAASSGSLAAEPAYSGCVINSLLAELDINGCKFELSAGTKTGAGGTFGLSCASEKSIQVTAFILGKFRPCLVIPPQAPVGAVVDYANGKRSGKSDVTVTWTGKGLTYTLTGSCGTGSFSDLEMSGEFTLWGENLASEPIDLSRDEATET